MRLKKINFVLLFLLLTSVGFSQVTLTATSGTTTGSYSTLKASFDAINLGTHTGVISITLTANTIETGSCVLNGSGTGSANYSRINIAPSGGANRIVTGAMPSGVPLIDLNGADSVLINGANQAGDSLTFSNTNISSTAGTCTIRFIFGASNNIITNCSILGSSTSSTNGVLIIGTDLSSSGTGNDNNIISNNSITNATATFPRNGIYAAGTTLKENDNNSISGNKIFNFYSSTGAAAVNLAANNTNFTISNNHFYQTNTRSVSGTYSGIYIVNTSGYFNIIGNYIGGSEPFCLGLPTKFTGSTILQAIYINASATNKSSIQGNKIANIELSTTSTSIVQALLYIVSGKLFIGNITPNTFGDDLINTSINYTSTPGSTTFSGIGYGTGVFDTVLIQNNIFAGITLAGTGGMSLRGIDITGSSAKNIIDNNIFGSTTTSNSLNQLTSNSIFGIINRGSTLGFVHQITNNKFGNLYCAKNNLRAISTGNATSWNVSNNEIFNLTCSNPTTASGASAPLIAIISSSTGPLGQTISKNKIYKLFCDATTATNIVAIQCSNVVTGGTCIVDKNLIHSLSSAGAQGGILAGIQAISGNYTYSNNMIRLGIDENGVGNPNATSFIGILETAGNNNFYFNSVYIGGNTVVSTAFDSYAFNSTATTGTRNIFNNLFVNLRSNVSGTGNHYAYGTATITGLEFRNNDYYTGSAFLAYHISNPITSIANHKATFTTDTFSMSIDPLFANANGASSLLDLHIASSLNPTQLESGGKTISGISVDFDSNVRPGPANSINGGGTLPDIGADEFDGAPFTPCVAPIAGTAFSNDSVACNGVAVQIGLAGKVIVGNSNTFQWEKSLNGTNYSYINGANDSILIQSGITSNTYFRCRLTCAIGQTTNTSIPCFVKARSTNISAIVEDTLCGPGIATISASTTNGTIYWYESLISTIPIASGNIFQTPLLNGQKVYYAQSEFLSCKSFKEAVYVYFDLPPVILTVKEDSSCAPASFSLRATANKGLVKWYETINSTTILATGNIFITPVLSSTTTYYAQANSGDCIGNRIAVTGKILGVPSIISRSSYIDTICATQLVKLFAKASKGNIEWYTSDTASNPIFIGDTLQAIATQSITKFYAQASTNYCDGIRELFIIQKNPAAKIDSVVANSSCGESTIVLKAFSNSGDVFWYSSLQSNVAIAQGNVFVTPVINSTTSYFVKSISSPCESNRVEVVATIYNLPEVIIAKLGDTLFTNKLFNKYEWYKNNAAISNSNFPKLVVTSNGTYKLFVTDSNGCSEFSNEIVYTKTGIAKNAKADVKIYPNPTTATITFENITAAYLELLDLQGRVLFRNDFTETISIKDFKAGLYFMRFLDVNNKVIYTQKIAKADL